MSLAREVPATWGVTEKQNYIDATVQRRDRVGCGSPLEIPPVPSNASSLIRSQKFNQVKFAFMKNFQTPPA